MTPWNSQIKNDSELYQMKMEAMQKEHQNEMQKVYEEQAKRMENDGKKVRDMARIMKENREVMKQQNVWGNENDELSKSEECRGNA